MALSLFFLSLFSGMRLRHMGFLLVGCCASLVAFAANGSDRGLRWTRWRVNIDARLFPLLMGLVTLKEKTMSFFHISHNTTEVPGHVSKPIPFSSGIKPSLTELLFWLPWGMFMHTITGCSPIVIGHPRKLRGCVEELAWHGSIGQYRPGR